MCTFSQSLKLGVTDMDLISNDQAQNTFVFQESGILFFIKIISHICAFQCLRP